MNIVLWTATPQFESSIMNERKEAETTESASSESTGTGQGTSTISAEGYLAEVREVLTEPDGYFARQSGGSQVNGLLTAGLFFAMLYVHSVVTRITRFSSWRFEFEFLIHAFKTTLAVALPLIAVIFALKWFEGRSGDARPLEFYIARFGALLILPTLMVALAIPLNLFDIALHGWLRGGALILVYLAVFLVSYWYAAKDQLRVAVLFTLGFYFTYRLLMLLFF
jgi:hypothetical protein